MSKREICQRCERPQNSCLCETISNIEIPNQVTILQDKTEAKHPFGTARFASLSCENIKIITSDHIDEDLIEELKMNTAFLLFKNEHSRPLNLSKIPSHNFVALDGTWKKSRKIYHTHPQLKELPCFHLEIDEGQETIYKAIRSSCGQEHLSTLEAIAITLLKLGDITSIQYEQFITPLKELIRQQELAISRANSKVVE